MLQTVVTWNFVPMDFIQMKQLILMTKTHLWQLISWNNLFRKCKKIGISRIFPNLPFKSENHVPLSYILQHKNRFPLPGATTQYNILVFGICCPTKMFAGTINWITCGLRVSVEFAQLSLAHCLTWKIHVAFKIFCHNFYRNHSHFVLF